LIYRNYRGGDNKHITLLIFVSGKVVITGAKTVEDLTTNFRYIVGWLNKYKKDDIEF
jgi:transcription initiation factor TFIID TATA-box-binding protein